MATTNSKTSVSRVAGVASLIFLSSLGCSNVGRRTPAKMGIQSALTADDCRLQLTPTKNLFRTSADVRFDFPRQQWDGVFVQEPLETNFLMVRSDSPETMNGGVKPRSGPAFRRFVFFHGLPPSVWRMVSSHQEDHFYAVVPGDYQLIIRYLPNERLVEEANSVCVAISEPFRLQEESIWLFDDGEE